MLRYNLTTGFASFYANRGLLRSIVVRDIQTRYRGTLLGFLWAVIYPLMMLAVYSVVFGSVFHARWGNSGNMKDFVEMLYCGLIVHGMLSETLTRSPAAILSNPAYVKKVVFPLELIPVSHLASALFNGFIGLGLLCIFLLFSHHMLPATVLLAPLILLPLLLVISGLAWFIAAVGVFFRDIGQMMGVAMSVLLFLSPVFYPASSAPALIRRFMNLNPISIPIQELRAVLVLGVQPNWLLLLVYSIVAVAVAVFGLWVFQRVRPAFADVI